jgi:hypothetical protein
MRRVALILAVGALAASPAVGARLAPGMADASSDVRPLPFLSDDYALALAEARARELPLFIEAWAPW